MTIDLNKGWFFCKEDGIPVETDLPHDAMLAEARDRICRNGVNTGYFPGGKYRYEKRFVLEEAAVGKSIVLHFEGVYQNCKVYLNGLAVGAHHYGYTAFDVDISNAVQAGENLLRVTVDNSLEPNCRWYSGSGIYRPVTMCIQDKNHISGVHLETLDIHPARVRAEITTTRPCDVTVEFYDGDTCVASGAPGVLEIPDAKLWSAENPYLYRVLVRTDTDEQTIFYGIRNLAWSAETGLTVNDKPVLLRGGCIHHDHGVLGACEYQDAEERRILVKDLSRFGRDYLTVGDYISRVFPFLGVRFISVNDGFDSSNPLDIDSLDTSFRTLIYDLYSRDLSRRVKSAKKARAERGAFLSPYAPYGYVKDPEDKNHLLVDAEAADVIRRIFQMAADGAKPWQIAAALNGDGVISPKNYKVEAGCTRTPWRSIQEENFWTASLVAKFLRDERYIGKTVFGKRSRDVVGSTHTVKIARNDWIVVPNRHEAIVPEALFQKAQAVMREYREYEVSSDSGNPLKRKVICGVCGHAMQRDSRKNGSYRCVTKRLNTGFDCSEDRIPESDILYAVIDTIQVYAQYAVSIDRLLQTRREQRQLDRKQAQRCLQTLQSQKLRLSQVQQDALYPAGLLRASRFVRGQAAGLLCQRIRK